MNDSSAIVSTRALVFRYPAADRAALDGIDLDIFPGEYLAVLGANGSGKSTLLKCVVGLLAPDSGSVSVSGGGDPRLFKRSVSVVLQNPDDQIVGTVVEEDVEFGLRGLRLGPAETARRVDAALRFVSLESKRRVPPHCLSGGERQRLALAGAVASDASVLALDEAASMLDPAGRAVLLDALDRYSAEGKTIVHVTHSMEEAARARRVVVLSSGRIAFDGRPADLFRRDELEGWGLELPEALRCSRALAARGIDFVPGSLDPDGFAAEYAASRASAGAGIPGAPTAARDFSNNGGAADRNPALRLERVRHRYLRGTPFQADALRGADLALGRGRALALVGTGGSGKSTLLRHGNAVLLPDSGAVAVLGADTLDPAVDLRALRRRAALSVQQPEAALFSRYLADDVAYGPRNKGLSGRDLVAAVRAAMDRAALPYDRYRDRETASLSGGEKRKAALAGVFAMDAELYLFDEPSAALDPVSRRAVMDTLLGLRESGAAVAATTHSMEEAARFDRVAVMRDGLVVFEGNPEAAFYERYDPAWGIALPWTAAAARALAARGVPVPGFPLHPEALAAALAGIPAAPRASVPQEAPDDAPSASAVPPRGRRRRGVGIEFFRNVVFGQFLDRPSPVRSLPPPLKYLGLAAAFVGALAGSDFAPALLTLAAVLSAGALARVGPRHLLRGLVPALPYLLFVAALQLAFSWPGDESERLLSFGFLDVTADELRRAGLLVLRFAALAAALSLFSAVTPLSEAAEGIQTILSPLSRFGFPAEDLALVAAIALRFAPVLAEEAERIAIAQLSRGGGYAGKGRVRAGIALTVPLFLRSLERAETLAAAIELRR